jgi:hypothetical protein
MRPQPTPQPTRAFPGCEGQSPFRFSFPFSAPKDEGKYTDKEFEALIKTNSGFYSARVVNRIMQHCNSVAIVKCDGSSATGFFVSFRDRNYLVTNHHVIGSRDEVDRTKAKIRLLKTHALLNKKFFYTSSALDCSFIGLHSLPEGAVAIPLVTPTQPSGPGCQIFILGHPQGSTLTFSHGPNTIVGMADPEIRHVAPTDNGSSGSPIFNEAGELIALHSGARPNAWKRGSYKYNVAFDIQRIIEWFSTQAPSDSESSVSADSLSE